MITHVLTYLPTYLPTYIQEPGLYTTAIKALLAYYHDDAAFTHIPLIVNMDGWVRGLGLELLTAILAEMQPHLVFRLQVGKDDRDEVGR